MLSVQGKGILFHNAYIHASREERNKLNKKPRYRQSAIIFTATGIIFLLNAVEMIVRSG
jgi:hypothetical protein